MKNNKLIAEFMGLTRHADGLEYYDEHGLELGDSSKYHTSWDWLMPVVHKIDKECRERLRLNHPLHIGSDIDGVYSQVVEFIKGYNISIKEVEESRLRHEEYTSLTIKDHNDGEQ